MKSQNTGKSPLLLGIVVIAKGQCLFLEIGKKKSNRQEQELKRKQINLSRQTMSNWVIESSERWLMPIYEELHKKLLKEDIIHADETELQVLHEPGKKAQSTSFMWLYRTGKYAENPIVLYDYKDNRRQENSAMFLKGFNGY